MTDRTDADRASADDRTADIADGTAARPVQDAPAAEPLPDDATREVAAPPRDATVDLRKETVDAARAEAGTVVGHVPAPAPPGGPEQPYGPMPGSWPPAGPPQNPYPSPQYAQQQYPTPQYPSTQYPSTQYPSTQYPPQQYPPQQWPPPTHALPQPGSPPLPPAGRNNTTALVIFGVLGALVITGGVWALLLLAGGGSAGRDVADGPTGAPLTTDAPLPPPSIAPLPPPSSAPPPSGGADNGPTGKVTVGWTLDGTDYTAQLDTTGSGGTAEVSYPDSTGATATVVQDLTFVSSDGRLAFVGSNPRDPATGAPSDSYLPDVFVLATREGQAGVYVEQVCDLSSRCAPATMK